MGKVVIITTGGTIACKASDSEGGVRPALTGEDLVQTIPDIGDLVDFEIRNFSQVPGGNLTFEMLFALAREIDQIMEREDVAGVVVTQGTDSMEETAFFMDLVLDNPKPLVMTGSMKTPDTPGFDGPGNIQDALVVAREEAARHMGVMVVMNGKVHAARYVAKMNTSSRDAFSSREAGILGQVTERRVTFFKRCYQLTETMPVLSTGLTKPTAWVECVKATLDPGTGMMDALIEAGVDGIILEAMGGGHVPECFLIPVSEATERGIAVVVTSRCEAGSMLANTYSFPGSELSLKAAGAEFSDLPGIKARIQLMLDLSL